MEKTDPVISKLLALHKIETTPIRIIVLRLFLSNPLVTHSHDNVLGYVRQHFSDVSPSAVSHTLRLYKARTILSETPNLQVDGHIKRGRPKTKFALANVNNMINDKNA